MKHMILLATFLASSAAVAAPADQEGSDKSGKQDKMICKRISATGSRLGGQRVCMTSSQWAEQKRQARQDVERGQASRSTSGAN